MNTNQAQYHLSPWRNNHQHHHTTKTATKFLHPVELYPKRKRPKASKSSLPQPSSLLAQTPSSPPTNNYQQPNRHCPKSPPISAAVTIDVALSDRALLGITTHCLNHEGSTALSSSEGVGSTVSHQNFVLNLPALPKFWPGFSSGEDEVRRESTE
ncbi:unnamed protein product [Fraxinus pennsylvanica]|uniref:Uncharacterized protein n=1 Tax=Fraxinus pennsylvanica TaxID=56036 RepID=A0AAD2E8F0_9LAMI|nr:unnamed protein product [Fraxinus pennsylvanica]